MPREQIDDMTMVYGEQGTGRPLVLLHGFPLDSRMWRHQVEALSRGPRGWRVITPDLRGFGQSRSEAPFSMASLADDVEKLLKRIDAIPCVLGGMSMGGYVALAYARKCPQHIDGLILSDTRASGDSPEARAGRERLIEKVKASGPKAVADFLLEKLVTEQTCHTRHELVKEIRQMMENVPPKTIEHALIAMRDRPDLTEFLPSIADPTLIITGELDPLAPPEVARAMHQAIAHSELAVIEGAAHLTQLEQPEQVNAAIDRFLAGL